MGLGRNNTWGNKRSNTNFQKRWLQKKENCCDPVIEPPPPLLPLCLWLSILPAPIDWTDPGSGDFWINGVHQVVGTFNFAAFGVLNGLYGGNNGGVMTLNTDEIAIWAYTDIEPTVVIQDASLNVVANTWTKFECEVDAVCNTSTFTVTDVFTTTVRSIVTGFGVSVAVTIPYTYSNPSFLNSQLTIFSQVTFGSGAFQQLLQTGTSNEFTSTIGPTRIPLTTLNNTDGSSGAFVADTLPCPQLPVPFCMWTATLPAPIDWSVPGAGDFYINGVLCPGGLVNNTATAKMQSLYGVDSGGYIPLQTHEVMLWAYSNYTPTVNILDAGSNPVAITWVNMGCPDTPQCFGTSFNVDDINTITTFSIELFGGSIIADIDLGIFYNDLPALNAALVDLVHGIFGGLTVMVVATDGSATGFRVTVGGTFVIPFSMTNSDGNGDLFFPGAVPCPPVLLTYGIYTYVFAFSSTAEIFENGISIGSFSQGSGGAQGVFFLAPGAINAGSFYYSLTFGVGTESAWMEVPVGTQPSNWTISEDGGAQFPMTFNLYQSPPDRNCYQCTIDTTAMLQPLSNVYLHPLSTDIADTIITDLTPTPPTDPGYPGILQTYCDIAFGTGVTATIDILDANTCVITIMNCPIGLVSITARSLTGLPFGATATFNFIEISC